MTTRTPIERVPIKIRKPIHKEFCSCWNSKVLSITGVPYLVMGDDLSIEELSEMLDSLEASVGFFFANHISESKDKIMLVLSKKLPVTIRTKCVLPTDMIDALRAVPHSSIQVSINFLDEFLRSRLEPESSDLFDLREMMSLAKSYKIFVVLVMDYVPHLVSKLDLYEIVDMTKNYISHMMLRYPEVRDEDLYSRHRSEWEALKPSYSDLFKQFYVANVPCRTWNIRPKYEKILTKELQDYLKPKKVGLEVSNWWVSHNRVRHEVSGLCDLPMGMRHFYYQKEDGVFVKVPEMLEQICKTCDLPMFE
jgi:hypothetical protein